jgi:hypothetical protein
MGKLIVDQIQKPGGSTFTLPSTAAAGVLQSDVSGNITIGSTKLLLVPETSSVVGMIVTTTAQANTYSTAGWTSNGPGAQLIQNAKLGSVTDSYASTYGGWNMLMGDGAPTATDTSIMYAYNREGLQLRQPYYANNKRIGHWMNRSYYNQNTTSDYTGLTYSVMPVRNTTSSAITRTFYVMHSSSFSSYGGASVAVFTPTTSSGTNYANVTGGAWTNVYAYTTDTASVTGNFSVTIPANTTILLFFGTSHQYATTNRFFDVHTYYNLDTSIDGTNLICDVRMLETLRTARNAGNTAGNTVNIPNYYTAAAALYGDR